MCLFSIQMEVPDLPEISLPISNGQTLPTFKFGAPAPAVSSGATSQPIKPLMASTPSPFGTTSAAGGSKTGGAFKFSSPIVKESAKSSEASTPAAKVGSWVVHFAS